MPPNKSTNIPNNPLGLEASLPHLAPTAIAASVALPLLAAIAARYISHEGTTQELAKSTQIFDFMLFGFSTLYLASIATVCLGCLIVRILKGSQRFADSYPVPHSDKPKTHPED